MLIIKTIAVVWTIPNTVLGCFLGLLGLLFGGKVQWVGGALEFHGGLVKWLLSLIPGRIHAMTLGHSIIGLSARSLEVARIHEHVHVRQYEWFGPLFIPCYLLASVFVWLQGKNAYRDNPFEVQAYRISDPDFGTVD